VSEQGGRVQSEHSAGDRVDAYNAAWLPAPRRRGLAPVTSLIPGQEQAAPEVVEPAGTACILAAKPYGRAREWGGQDGFAGVAPRWAQRTLTYLTRLSAGVVGCVGTCMITSASPSSSVSRWG
jgi:hypothetical protein